jgi:putative ubiquitin-RnfH superfamily antitoxin RatB of RatAB toxin-antitoxin module
LAQSGVLNEFPSLAQAPLMLGIWGKRARPESILRENDRVEIYRELKVDPKVARRERFSRQGAKGAGLFSARRPGAKAGY